MDGLPAYLLGLSQTALSLQMQAELIHLIAQSQHLSLQLRSIRNSCA